MTNNRAKALEAFDYAIERITEASEGNGGLVNDAALNAYFMLKDHGKKIREALTEPKWKSMDSIPANGQFLCAWPEVKLDEDGDMTEEKTGKYFIGSADRSCGQSNGEPDSLNSMGEWYGDDTCWASEPTHWMHLPDAPTGEES